MLRSEHKRRKEETMIGLAIDLGRAIARMWDGIVPPRCPAPMDESCD